MRMRCSGCCGPGSRSQADIRRVARMFRSIFRLSVRPPSVEQEVGAELDFHFATLVDALKQQGLSEAAARVVAEQRFGDVRRTKEELMRIDRSRREGERRIEWWREFAQDVRFAVRGLRRRPAFVATVALTLGLAIGVNSAVFSLVDAILLRPLPGVLAPEELVEFGNTTISYPGYHNFVQDAAPVLDLAGFAQRTLGLAFEGRSQLVRSGIVSGNYFAVLGGRVSLGRPLGPADDAPGAPPVVVVSNGFWARFLGGDARVLGRAIIVDAAPLVVVGIADPAFRGTRLAEPLDLWIPMAAWPIVAPSQFIGLDLGRRGWTWMRAVGRLRPGVARDRAEAVVALSARHQFEAFPKDEQEHRSIKLVPATVTATGLDGRQAVVGFLLVLMMLVTTVLLLACVNVATLLLARALERDREMGIRLAIGAGQGRLVRQLFNESLVLAGLGAAVGIAILFVALRGMSGVNLGGELTLAGLSLRVNGMVLLFTIGVTLVASLGFGLAPAFRSSRVDPVRMLHGGAAGTPSRGRGRSLLLTLQLGLSLLLLIAAGLFGRGLQKALSIDPGFTADNLAMASVNLGLARYDPARATPFFSGALTRVLQVPGVESAAWTSAIPLTPDSDGESYSVVGNPPTADRRPIIELAAVSPGFWRTIGMRIQRGRDFEDPDVEGAPHVVIINEAMAATAFRGQNPLGQRIAFSPDTATVVGIVSTVKQHTLREDPLPQVYIPLAQHVRDFGLSQMTLLVRGRKPGDDQRVLSGISRTLQISDPAIAVFSVGTYADHFRNVLAPQRFGALLFGAFSGLALLVAVIGAYGVVDHLVALRARELGIRIALGAGRNSVIPLVLGGTLKYVAVGVAVGILLAVLLTRLMAAFLYDVSPVDPTTFSLTALGLLAVSAAAAYVPARRAARLDPLKALRQE